MKQFFISYKDEDRFKTELQKIHTWSESNNCSVLFIIYTTRHERDVIDGICGLIDEYCPESKYIGASTNGNIMSGRLAECEILICCNVFEYETTKVKVLQYDLSDECVDETMDSLHKIIQRNPWVKAIEFFTTIRNMSMTHFCQRLQEERKDICIFGGGAFAVDVDDYDSCVFAKGGGYSKKGVVFMLVGGEDFNVTTTHIVGWKPLGKVFNITKAKGSIMYELDNKPAYDVYYKYLNIRNDKNFFSNSLEFPFFYRHNGMNILRAPVSSNPDGSLTMTSDIEENVHAYLSYGNPITILKSVHEESQKIKDFMPEVIHIFSCAARRTFWGDADIGSETMPFQEYASTSGFYTSSEFLRTDGYVNQHNVTLVIGAFREGKTIGKPLPFEEYSEHELTGKVSLITRLATFINAATEELETANRKLIEASITDGLTGLLNRKEIQRLIEEKLKSGEPFSLIMIDIDNFKQVNDTYGHSEGDRVIIGLAEMLKRGSKRFNEDVKSGRWGGEEFMMLMPYKIDHAVNVARDMRRDFAKEKFPNAGNQTISIGVTAVREGDNIDTLLIRVDKALYEAKHTGKNKYVVF